MIKSFVIAESQRGLLIEDGRVVTLLGPGRHRFWDWHNRQHEGLRWLQSLLAAVPETGEPRTKQWISLHARALDQASWLATLRTEPALARAYAEQSVVLYRQVDDAGHSVQSDQPRALIDLLRGVLDAR